METKQIEKMSDDEYFALKAISASQIKQYDKGAYWFWKSSPFNPEKAPEKASDALAFGKLCHCMLLEPDEVEKRFMVVDFGKTRTTKKYTEAVETYPGYEIVTQDEMDRAKKMIEEIGKHPLASRIIAGATPEMPYTWTDKETGLPCKCKIDAIKRTKNGIVVIDYKTSSDIQSVLNWPQKLQYPLQAEFYSQAVKEKYGEDPCEFIFIIQSNKEGEEDVIAVANVEYDTGLVAKDIVKSHMNSIATRLKLWNESQDKSIWAAYPNRVEMRYSNWYMDRGE
jgi:exodeoxyribonuclease VIII